jgi:PhnB protein
LLVGSVIALCSERSIAVYVDDVDETYQRAVAVGTETVEAPTDQFYGDHRAMVRDRFGNMYPIAPPIES